MQLDNKDWFSKLEVYILGILSRLFCPNVFLFDRSDVLCLDLYAKGARGMIKMSVTGVKSFPYGSIISLD